MKCTNRRTITCVLFTTVWIAPISLPAQKNSEIPSGTPKNQTGGVRTPSADQQSCRDFVQRFYDWYWNRFADQENDPRLDIRKEPNVWMVLKHRPTVLSPELRRLLASEEKKMRATNEIGNLDFDPFWGNQDAQGKYTVDQVKTSGDRCEATIPQGRLTAELERSGAGWEFANFYYSETRQDLLGILSPRN